ncbi:MAG: hypothetical protein OXI81_07750 [Paracoccaceae bacterium]|nr:hypothetical protein [Paracoccaceae bacterium]MDE2912063.1 hypothetical protein [Paracoccaceae bacterium]
MLIAGIAVTLLGVAGLLGCAVGAYRARRSGQTGTDLAERLGRLIPWNLASLLVSVIGLALVIFGMLL